MAVLAILLFSTGAGAQTLFDRGPPAHRLVHRTLLAVRVNPGGLALDSRLAYRLRLFEHESRALRDNYLGLGAGLTVSPSFARLGPVVELAPASMITLWASFQLVSYFGTLHQLQSFPDGGAVYDDDSLDAGEGYASLGTEAAFGADVQAKVGPIALRARNRVVRADLDLHEGDEAYYDSVTDTLLTDRGFSFSTDVDLLWVGLENRLVAGLRYSATVPVEALAQDDRTVQRFGPIVAYSFYVRDGARWNAPSVFLLVQWWVTHPYRRDDPGKAVPLVAAGFQVSGDLIPLD
jgi:hypothetical protein